MGQRRCGDTEHSSDHSVQPESEAVEIRVGLLPRPSNGFEEDLQRPTVGVRGGHSGATMVDTDPEGTDREPDAFVPVVQEVDSDDEHDRARFTRSIQAAFASFDAVVVVVHVS